MLPLRDTIPCRTYPVVTTTLIAVNVLIYGWQLLLDDRELVRFLYTYGLVPARYTVPTVAAHFSLLAQLCAPFSFMFLHGSMMHLASNMWSLYIFGDNVEDHLGPLRYLCFYFLAGITSGMAQFMTGPASTVPVIGASGAIAGIMGAYFLLFPNARVLTLIPIIIIPYFVEIPAFVFLGLWFVLQLLNATWSGNAAAIAWWAHIGGFIGGIVLLKLFNRLPAGSLNQRLHTRAARKTSRRLPIIKTTTAVIGADLHGTITVSHCEAFSGTRKLVCIQTGMHKRMLRVTIPAGTGDGTVLRLRGLGRTDQSGQKGNILLRVNVRI